MKKRIFIISCVVILAVILGVSLMHHSKEFSEDRERIESIGLCFTEGHIANRSEEALQKRFQDYVTMGVKTLRYETQWVSLSKGKWSLSSESQDTLQAAIDAGLRLKLISPTIMVPQSWVTSDPDAAMINYNGVRATNTISYWYEGIYDYTSDAINCQLEKYAELGILDHVDALVVDFGPAGEPLYPAAWTQTGDLENPDNAATSMWCYGENAVQDFRETMLEKYGSIEAINGAWGTELAAMDAFQMPLPSTVKGQQWEDILIWYLESKREFVERQIQIFQDAVNTRTEGRVKLILYMPGASFTQAEWDECVQTGDASFAMLIGSENEFIVQMADKYDCLLQFTGLPGIEPLKQVRQWMYAQGYCHIPVIGENYADYASSCDPEALYQVIEDFNLAGLDYTFTKFLYEEDGMTPSEIYPRMVETLPKIDSYIRDADFEVTPYLLSEQKPKPRGDVLTLKVTLDSQTNMQMAMVRCKIADLGYEIQEGDVLEYDVKISQPCNGFGFLDGTIDGAGRLSNMVYCTDQYGILASPEDSLAVQAGGQWMHRIIGIDIPYCSYDATKNTTGKILKDLSLIAQPTKINGNFTYHDVIVFYDNIVISNNGKVKLAIFENHEDVVENIVISKHNAEVEVLVEDRPS